MFSGKVAGSISMSSSRVDELRLRPVSGWGNPLGVFGFAGAVAIRPAALQVDAFALRDGDLDGPELVALADGRAPADVRGDLCRHPMRV
jgi:hypothetical protein